MSEIQGWTKAIRNKPDWIFLLCLAGTALLYMPTLPFAFVYDDHWTLLRNPALRDVFPLSRFLLNAQTAALPESGIAQDVYRPISTISFALQLKWHGFQPALFRLANVLLHFLNGVLLWSILRSRLGRRSAIVGAGVFMLHPIQIESVVWITQRSVLFCGAAVLAALVVWNKNDGRPAWALCWLYLLALLSKESAAGLPLLFLMGSAVFRKPEAPGGSAALDSGGPKTGGSPARIGIGVGFAALVVGYGALRYTALGHWNQAVHRAAPLSETIPESLQALLLYARNICWPSRLNVSYRWPEHASFSSWPTIGGLLVLIGLAAIVIYGRKIRPWISFGAAGFLVFWLPHAGLFPMVTFMADRFLYLPMAGVSVIVASFAERPKSGWILFPVVGVLFIVSLSRAVDWKNDRTLWESSIRTDASNAFAHACLAQVYKQEGNRELAMKHYELSLRNKPTVGLAKSVLKNMEFLSAVTGHPDDAAKWRKHLDNIPPG